MDQEFFLPFETDKCIKKQLSDYFFTHALQCAIHLQPLVFQELCNIFTVNSDFTLLTIFATLLHN